MTRAVYRATQNPDRGYRAVPTKLHDGDSFWVMADTGFGSRFEPELRLLDVSAPELHPIEAGAQEVTDFVNRWLSNATAATPFRHWPLWVSVKQTTAFEPGDSQTFTRYLATVWVFGQQGSPDASINALARELMASHPEWPAGN
jgi:endonuclease YncB( thermonuclease family)